MYLLGNPDHYTGHSFVPFYWQSFVTYVRRELSELDDSREQVKVAIVRSNGRVVGISPVLDYVHRSAELENISLYEWIRCFTREKLVKNTKGSKNKQEEDGDSSLISDSYESSFIDDDDDDSTASLEESNKSVPVDREDLPDGSYYFKHNHPLYESHIHRYIKNNTHRVPNFLGGNLPRRDQGDREYYCCTMLTLFKPWRQPSELKTAGSWDQCFSEHKFSKRDVQLMDNFNVRYECLDARDDFRAQLKKG
ncbi:hypothetical protein CPB84DRAFT_1690107, partial [Gymnopilus junonius]